MSNILSLQNVETYISQYHILQGINFDNIKEFNRKKFHKAHRTYVVLGNKEQVDMEALKKFGKVKELTLEEIFGY